MGRQLTPKQQQTVQAVLRVGRRKKASPRERKAAVETIGVEANYQDVPHGDRDSEGAFQQRPSQGWGPASESLERDAEQFFDAAKRANTGRGSAGQLAQRVQRSAFGGRYDQLSGEADALLRSHGGGGTRTTTSTPWRLEAGTSSSFDQAGFDQAAKRAKVGQLLARRKGTDSILFRSGLLSTAAPDPGEFTSEQRTSKIVPGKVTVTESGGALGAAAAHGAAGRAVQAAGKRLGVAETGKNRGGRIDKWQAKFGMVGQPWCGIFTGIALREAGVKVTPRIASVEATIADARAGQGGFRKFLPAKQAKQGDVFTIGSGTHMGLIEKNNGDGTVTTLEGNTSSGRSERKTRKISELSGVARPRYGRG